MCGCLSGAPTGDLAHNPGCAPTGNRTSDSLVRRPVLSPLNTQVSRGWTWIRSWLINAWPQLGFYVKCLSPALFQMCVCIHLFLLGNYCFKILETNRLKYLCSYMITFNWALFYKWRNSFGNDKCIKTLNPCLLYTSDAADDWLVV